jgi:hypothetical protein
MNYALLIYESAAGFALRTDPQKQELIGRPGLLTEKRLRLRGFLWAAPGLRRLKQGPR